MTKPNTYAPPKCLRCDSTMDLHDWYYEEISDTQEIRMDQWLCPECRWSCEIGEDIIDRRPTPPAFDDADATGEQSEE